MRKILVLGAGRSASSLIQYLIEHAGTQQWRVTVADMELHQARQLIGAGGDAAEAIALDASAPEARRQAIAGRDLVISMLPAVLHMDVVRDCLAQRIHVITPSYVPDAMWDLADQAKEAGVIVLNELGVDPGIDHMSAMRLLDRIRAEGGVVQGFESFTGGLVAPQSDNNPWGYKFTWNPRNVVLAGQGGAARFIREGRLRYIPYHKLFTRHVLVEVPGYGRFDGYANRDSLKYRSLYGLDSIPTLIRGTLRREGFCDAWNAFVQLGCTDDSYSIVLPAGSTWAGFFDRFLPPDAKGDMRGNMARYLGIEPGGDVMNKLDWLGVFADEPIGIEKGTPASILQILLESRWSLAPDDKDMIVMQHIIHHDQGEEHYCTTSSLVVEGQDSVQTAMARTVGLPVAIAAKMVLNDQVDARGVLMPLTSGLYDPILDELAELGIAFQESTRNLGRQ